VCLCENWQSRLTTLDVGDLVLEVGDDFLRHLVAEHHEEVEALTRWDVLVGS
jgi:hypothetical protein